MSDFVIEAKEVTKSLGRGAGEVQALQAVSTSRCAGGELTLTDGAVRQRQDHAVAHPGLHADADRGTVRVRGTHAGGDHEGLAKLRRDHIGFVFQSYHLFPTLTAAENVQLALDIRGERGRRAANKAREALDMVGLQKKAKTRPGELSGGEQQRVAIARALVANPSAVLADEPTSSLDGDNGRTIMRILADAAHQRGQAVLVVTHDPRIVPFADRIIHIEDGLLVGRPAGETEGLRLPKVAAFGPISL